MIRGENRIIISPERQATKMALSNILANARNFRIILFKMGVLGFSFGLVEIIVVVLVFDPNGEDDGNDIVW